MDKDQEMFIAHCKAVLGGYQSHSARAKKIYREAYELEPVSYKKSNAGIIAGNSYMLEQLKLIGEENWRPEKSTGKPKPRNYSANGSQVDSGVKKMKPIPKGIQGIKLDW